MAAGCSHTARLTLVLPVLVLLLATAPAAAPAATPASDTSLWEPGPKLNQIAAWTLDEAGNATRTDVFCSGSLANPAGSAVLTERASAVLRQLCSTEHRTSAFFSGSMLDTIAAARFSLAPKASDTPNSTEPNTPWMVADYVITTTKEQSRADSGKRLDAEAQVDLFACLDANCTTLGDLRINSIKGPLLLLALAGIPNGPMVGARTALFLSGSKAMEQSDLVPRELQPSAGAPGPVVREVVWEATGSRPETGYVPPEDVMSAEQAATFASENVWSNLIVGHYKAGMALPSRFDSRPSPPNGQFCITLVTPKHPWMDAHGWNSSDAECAEQYERARSGAEGVDAPPVYLFDSYFPQARLLGGPPPLRAWRGSTYTNLRLRDSDVSVTEYLGRRSLNASVPFTDDTYFGAGRKGGTFRDAEPREVGLLREYNPLPYLAADRKLSPATHSEALCVVSCDLYIPVIVVEGPTRHFTDFSCGFCSVLVIGSAAVAAVPVRARSEPYVSNTPSHFPHAFIRRTLDVMRLYTQMDASEPLPWCDSRFLDAVFRPLESRTFDAFKDVQNVSIASPLDDEPMPLPLSQTLPLSVLVEGISPRGFYDYFLNDSLAFADSVVANCTLWDSLGVGFAHPPHGSGAAHTVQTSAFPGMMTPFWANDSLLEDGEALEQAARALIADATQLLDQLATQELATTDSTKTVAGAMLDLSVTVVAIVAMACSSSDILAWAHNAISCCSCRGAPPAVHRGVAGLITCIIVLLGLVMAPAFIVAGELDARRTDSNDGSTSRVGLLASDDGSGGIVIALLTVRIKTVYDSAALGLEWLNLVLACVAALSICLDVVWPGNPLRRRRRAARRALQRQDATKVRGEDGVDVAAEVEEA